MDVPTPHEKFDAADADIGVISSDNVLFRIHSKNFAFASNNAVPNMSSAPKGENSRWDETASVLETFFAFIYFDAPHPDLNEDRFEKVQAVGRLANKWTIPHATTICKQRMLYAWSHSLVLQ
ncbi:hypothetical protein DL96DRAFT_1815793 [Flagelloscypha sp. PMI_526]|nr:hypothetical protein DL96DRAFT_1815793 [Flagelloscypha sp. PMI_526]